MQTITHRVRTFLSQQGAAIEPWSGLDATYSELYALLDRRRDDPALWGPIEQLLREVLERAADPEAERRLAAPAAELLSSWDAAELVASLRKALSDAALSDAPPARGGQEYRSLTRQLSPSVLGAFLVLGLAAAGCGSDHDAEPGGTGGNGSGASGGAAMTGGATHDGGTGGVATGGGGTGGVATGGGGTGGVATGGGGTGGVATGGGGTGGVATGGGGVAGGGMAGGGMAGGGMAGGGMAGGGMAGGGMAGGGVAGGGMAGGGGATGVCLIEDAEVLASTINDSTLSTAEKSSLCDCMTQLSENWRDGLTSLFQTGTPEQIAIALEEMLVCCSEGLTIGTFSQNELLQGTLCEPFVGTGGVYKGVSFPD